MAKSVRIPPVAFLVGIPLIAVAVAAGVATSWHLSAERQWADYVAEARRQGTKLERREFAEPEIAREENFAGIPLWEDLFSPDVAVKEKAKKVFALGAGAPGVRSFPSRVDLGVWQQWMQKEGWLKGPGNEVATDVLQGLSRFDEPLAAVEAAEARPASRFPADWSRNVMADVPHIFVMADLAKIYEVQMVALLRLGRKEEAALKFASGMRLVRALRTEPALLPGLVRDRVMLKILGGLAEGLAGHQWDEAQLRSFDEALAGAEILEDYRFCLEGERAGGNAFYDDCAMGSSRKECSTAVRRDLIA